VIFSVLILPLGSDICIYDQIKGNEIGSKHRDMRNISTISFVKRKMIRQSEKNWAQMEI
jgi:hypothetical protein